MVLPSSLPECFNCLRPPVTLLDLFGASGFYRPGLGGAPRIIPIVSRGRAYGDALDAVARRGERSAGKAKRSIIPHKARGRRWKLN